MYNVLVSICAFLMKVKEHIKRFLRKHLTSFLMLPHTFGLLLAYL